MENVRRSVDRPIRPNPGEVSASPKGDFVQDTRARLDDWLTQGDLQAAAIPREMALTQTEKGGVTTTHVTRAFTSPDYAWLRLSEIFSERGTLIVNLAAFPRGSSLLPLVQAEVVIVRGRVVLAIYDSHALVEEVSNAVLPETPAQLCDRLRQEFRVTLPQVTERPDWTEGVVSEHALWSRPMTAESVAPALRALDHFLEGVGQACQVSAAAGYPARDPEAAALVNQRVAAARRQSLDGNPSKRFLETTFGKEWSNRFLEEVLYPEWLGESAAQG